MPFVEYSGEVLSDDKKPSEFEKDKDGFKVSSQDDLKERVGNDWWHLPAATIGAFGLGLASKGVWDWYNSKTKPESTRVEPTFTPEPVVEQPVDKLQQAQQRAESGRAAGIGQAPVQPPVQVPAQAPQAAAPVQPPVAPQPPAQATPTVTEAIATGQSPAKAIQADVAKLIDEAPAPAAAPETKVSQRVRRTAEQIEKDLAESFAKAPPGMRPAAPAKTNKLPGDVIGQGGWHWYQGQMGPEAETEWLRQFGRTPQTYADVRQAVKEGRLPVPAPVEGKKGGTHPRQEFVPEYIKGSASLAQLGQLAMNALGAAGLLQAFKQGQETGDYSDFGLGAAGQVLGNIAPKAGLGLSLMAPGSLNTGEQEELAKRRKKKVTID